MFEHRLIPPWALFEEIRVLGAASTKELKENFGVDSASIRRSLAPLFAADVVWACTAGKAFYYMVNTGVKGRPSPNTARAEARKGNYAVPANVPDFRRAMGSLMVEIGQVGWTSREAHERTMSEIQAAEQNPREVYSFEDDDEAEELEY